MKTRRRIAVRPSSHTKKHLSMECADSWSAPTGNTTFMIKARLTWRFYSVQSATLGCHQHRAWHPCSVQLQVLLVLPAALQTEALLEWWFLLPRNARAVSFSWDLRQPTPRRWARKCSCSAQAQRDLLGRKKKRGEREPVQMAGRESRWNQNADEVKAALGAWIPAEWTLTTEARRHIQMIVWEKTVCLTVPSHPERFPASADCAQATLSVPHCHCDSKRGLHFQRNTFPPVTWAKHLRSLSAGSGRSGDSSWTWAENRLVRTGECVCEPADPLPVVSLWVAMAGRCNKNVPGLCCPRQQRLSSVSDSNRWTLCFLLQVHCGFHCWKQMPVVHEKRQRLVIPLSCQAVVCRKAVEISPQVQNERNNWSWWSSYLHNKHNPCKTTQMFLEWNSTT